MKKVNAILVSTALLLGALLLIAKAQSSSEIQEQINAITSKPAYSFARDLTVGSRGEDVRILQQFLNSHGAQVATSGFGSPNNETTYFGGATRAALARWQMANAIFPTAGYFGPKSRMAMALMMRSAASARGEIFASTSDDGRTVSVRQATSGLPIRLRIKRIGIDAAIEYVGLTADGAMDIPKGPNNTAWFFPGPRPGEVGSAVIAGHFGWKNGIAAVFDNLHNLQKGDEVEIEDDRGVIITFIVRESQVYGENDGAASVFNSTDGKVHLNLVTCQGVWNKDRKSYSKRLVVFTDKKME